MGFNGKHLSLEYRKIIEENINKGLREFETLKELNKSQSTIGKEIKKCLIHLIIFKNFLEMKFIKGCLVYY